MSDMISGSVKVCFIDGLACPSCCSCLADLDKPVGSVRRCERFVLARRVRGCDKPLDRRRCKGVRGQ
jgi:hypothetical protein